jgi:hypothetical protein
LGKMLWWKLSAEKADCVEVKVTAATVAIVEAEAIGVRVDTNV